MASGKTSTQALCRGSVFSESIKVFQEKNTIDKIIFDRIDNQIDSNISYIEQKDHEKDNSDSFLKYTHKFIKKITYNLESFSYNIIIANIYELYTFVNSEINQKYTKKTLLDNYKKILITLNPIIPHFSSEALKDINCLDKLSWPTYNESLLREDTIPFVIQINGKKRGLIEIKTDQSDKEILNLIYQDNNLNKYLNDKEIKKKIFVPNRLMNIIV